MIATQTRTADSLVALNESSDHMDPEAARVAEMAESMSTDGWVGEPILTAGELALTGTHRIAAARIAGIDVPVADLYDLDDDADALVGAILTATDYAYDGITACAEALALIAGRDATAAAGSDLDYDAEILQWALDTDNDDDTLAALRNLI